jgi:adenosylcobinamide-GDP ribazoletransferase
LSIGLFTAVPVAPRNEIHPSSRQVRGALLLGPGIGLVLGLIVAAFMYGLRAIMDHSDSGTTSTQALLAAVLSLGLLVLATGGLHWDGLADTVDGMASRGSREQTLAVMRRSDIGALGALTMLVVFTVQVAALALSIINGHGTIAMVTAVVAGRLAVLWSCRHAAARSDGLGAWVAGQITWWAALGVTLVALMVPAALLVLDDDPAAPAAVWVLPAIPIALICSGLLLRWWRARVGGMTGDLIGATVEVTTTLVLVLVALAP